MSYILDALRRADAERSRGAVPGLHAQSLPQDDEPAASDRRPLLWAAGGAGALLLAGVTVLVVAPWRAAPSGPAALVAAPQLNAAPAANDAPAAFARGETPPAQPGGIAPAALPVEPPIARTPPANVAVAPLQQPPALSPRLAERAAQGRVGVLESRAAAARDAAGAQAAANDAAPRVEHYGPPVDTPAPMPVAVTPRPAAIPAVNDLPPDIRATLPHLAVGGAIYSAALADRMLILNGQVFHEGDKPAPDTVLEQIRLKSAVLNFRGQRYEIAY